MPQHGSDSWGSHCEFLANPAVELLSVDHHVARIYAEIVADLRKAGTPIPTNDIWIAAAAARAGATILTYDAHFRSISRVGSLVLPAASGPPTGIG